MIQLIVELPDVSNIKEKRKIVKSLKERLRVKYHISAAEVDLLDSLSFAQIGGAMVSNSRIFGEGVMQKVLRFVEDEVPGRLQDVKITSEIF